ncbi:MAG: ABC transporter permease, partial [Pseudomonadota bacterium]
KGINRLKTIKFGDESTVISNGFAAIASLVTIFVLWCLATGSSLLPISLPTPYNGDAAFTYTLQNEAGDTSTAKVLLKVHPFEDKSAKPAEVEPVSAESIAQPDSYAVAERRRLVTRVLRNDAGYKEAGYKIVAIDGKPIQPRSQVETSWGVVAMLGGGSLQVRPDVGLTMDPLYLPTPEGVWKRFTQLHKDGYQNTSLWIHLLWSLARVIVGFALGCLIGIPLGYAVGLAGWFRGWWDPIVEFMRPIPPLALIPLVIIWFGIREPGKIVLLFLAALWIMIIATRAGVSGVNIAKVHAAYSLGARKWQVLMRVIVPNSLPEIFTGARVAMGVCWGTVVAAEFLGAEKGIGMMISTAASFTQTDIVIIGITLIGIVGAMIEIIMRYLERWLVPWKGRS